MSDFDFDVALTGGGSGVGRRIFARLHADEGVARAAAVKQLAETLCVWLNFQRRFAKNFRSRDRSIPSGPFFCAA
jgi:hypothetical protein